MTTTKDTIRKASIFTLGGLVDPRVMPGYVDRKADSMSFNLGGRTRRLFENLFNRIERGHASM